ncbi:MAG: DNA-binding protein [Paludibacteraceae bacterium]|nr:DNA-binding protein [Paludibacteraceae bacterium]
MTTTFNKLRQVKDSLPKGSSQKIADELGLTADIVREYFHGGNHIEQGPDGGIVTLDDTRILEVALRMAWENA